MKQVQFQTSAGDPRQGTIIEWADEMPLFFKAPFFPPYEVVKRYARKGLVDHGMSGYLKWEPFELAEEDYEELRNEYISREDSNARFPEITDTFTDEIAWTVWLFEKAYGVPREQHEQFLRKLELLRRNRDTAASAGSAALSDAHSDYVRVGNELAAFLQKHMRAYPRGVK